MPPKKASLVAPTADDIMLTKKILEDLEMKKLRREEKQGVVKTKNATSVRQQKVVDILTKERDDIEDNLNLVQSLRICQIEKQQTEEVNALFNRGDKVDMEIQQEKKYIEDLEAQIQKESIQIEYHRKKTKSNVLSDYRQVEENQRADRMKSSWMSKLNVEQVQLNSGIKDNADLRQKIWLLLKEKAQFNQLFEEMVQKLNRGKAIMEDVVKQSTAHYAKRDEMARKIQVLRERDNADLENRQEEMQDLMMKLNEDKDLAIFKQKVLKVREKLNKLGRESMKAEGSRNHHERRLDELSSFWDTLKKEVGLDECLEVCNFVAKLEQENFSLFNYNNELRCQLETLTEKTAQLIKEVEDGQDDAFRKEDEADRLKSQVKYQLNCLREEEDDLKDIYEAACRLYDRLLSKVQTLFDVLKCEMWPLEQLLGDNKDMNQYNYKLYLNLVESKIIKLLSFVPEKQPLHSVISIPQLKIVKTDRSNTVVDRKQITLLCTDCVELRKRLLPTSDTFV